MHTRRSHRGAGHLRNRPVIAIASEGSHMEPLYFEALNTKRGCYLQFVPSSSKKPSLHDLISDLSRWSAKNGLRGRGQGWLVVNRLEETDRSTQEIASFCEEAKNKGFNVAISDPCFEAWLWLHLREEAQFPNRASVIKELSLILPHFQSGKFDPAPFLKTVQSAIARAQSLATWNGNGTNVHILAQRILMHGNN